MGQIMVKFRQIDTKNKRAKQGVFKFQAVNPSFLSCETKDGHLVLSIESNPQTIFTFNKLCNFKL